MAESSPRYDGPQTPGEVHGQMLRDLYSGKVYADWYPRCNVPLEHIKYFSPVCLLERGHEGPHKPYEVIPR